MKEHITDFEFYDYTLGEIEDKLKDMGWIYFNDTSEWAKPSNIAGRKLYHEFISRELLAQGKPIIIHNW